MADPTQPDPTVAHLLDQAGKGDSAALSRVLDVVYAELRSIAAAQMRGERPDHGHCRAAPARIVPGRGRPELLIDDLGSRNGTWLNGAPVRGSTVLRSGDTVRLGATGPEFELSIDVSA